MTTDKAVSGNLAQRIARASAEVGGKLSPDKRNQEQKYDYISSDKMLAVIGQAMAENGIVVLPAVAEHEMQIGQSGSGKSRYDVRVKFDMMVTDGTTSLTLPWYGVGNDFSSPDKATYKAITSGHKYFLSKLFCVGAGNEDGEHDEEKQTVQPRVVKPQPPRNVQPQPSQTQHRPAKLEPAPEFTMSDVGELNPNPPDDLWKPNEYPQNGNGKANGKPAKPAEFVWHVDDEWLGIAAGIIQMGELTGKPADMVTYFTKKHNESDKSMSTSNKDGKGSGQYGFLVSLLDKRYGKNSHRMILSCLCSTPITGDNPPGWKVKDLLDWLQKPDEEVAKTALTHLDTLVEFIKGVVVETEAA